MNDKSEIKTCQNCKHQYCTCDFPCSYCEEYTQWEEANFNKYKDLKEEEICQTEHGTLNIVEQKI